MCSYFSRCTSTTTEASKHSQAIIQQAVKQASIHQAHSKHTSDITRCSGKLFTLRRRRRRLEAERRFQAVGAAAASHSRRRRRRRRATAGGGGGGGGESPSIPSSCGRTECEREIRFRWSWAIGLARPLGAALRRSPCPSRVTSVSLPYQHFFSFLFKSKKGIPL